MIAIYRERWLPSGCLWAVTEEEFDRRPHVESCISRGARSGGRASSISRLEYPTMSRKCSQMNPVNGTRRKGGKDDEGARSWNSKLKFALMENLGVEQRGAQTRHTLGSRHREKKRIGIEERCSGASGDGTDIRTDDEASRAISYRVRSFVRSVPCSHRALQSATDSPPLTPLQRPSTPLRPSSPSGEENRKQRLPPPPQRRTWFLRNRPIGSLRTTLRACHVGRYVAGDWPGVWRAGVLSNRTCPRARRRLLPHPPRNYRETIPPLFPPPRLDKRPRRNKEKRVCLRESTLVNPTARDLNKSAGLSRALSPTLAARPILPTTHSIFLSLSSDEPPSSGLYRAIVRLREIAEYHDASCRLFPRFSALENFVTATWHETAKRSVYKDTLLESFARDEHSTTVSGESESNVRRRRETIRGIRVDRSFYGL